MEIIGYLKHQRDMKLLANEVATEVQLLKRDLSKLEEWYRLEINGKPDQESEIRAVYDLKRWEKTEGIDRQKRRPIFAMSQYLVTTAESLTIPLPDKEDGKLWSSYNWPEPHEAMTTVGIAQLRSAIRRELKEQVEVVQVRLAIIFGLVGAVTGITSLIISLAK